MVATQPAKNSSIMLWTNIADSCGIYCILIKNDDKLFVEIGEVWSGMHLRRNDMGEVGNLI